MVDGLGLIILIATITMLSASTWQMFAAAGAVAVAACVVYVWGRSRGLDD